VEGRECSREREGEGGGRRIVKLRLPEEVGRLEES